jgi:hypothetical protein
MSVFSNVLALVGLLCAIALVSAEVRALVLALHFAAGTKYRGRERMKLIALRYEFSSPLFHQRFATKRGQKPAYSTFGSYLLFVLTVTVAKAAGYEPGAELGQMLGAGFLVSGAYFATRYGKAFMKQREFVAEVNAKGHPLKFA